MCVSPGKLTAGAALALAVSFFLVGCLPPAPAGQDAPPSLPSPPPPSLPHGIAAGDISHTSAVLWTRSTATGPVTFTHRLKSTGPPTATIVTVQDPTVPVTLPLTGLQPDSQYAYTVTNSAGAQTSGQFRTPALPGESRGLRFGAFADWRGDLPPYPAIANAPQRNLDFFVVLGDSIYADFESPAYGQARFLPEFRIKHAEVYSTAAGFNAWANLRASTALYATIDDHEILNDFAGGQLAAESRYFGETSGYVNQARRFRHGLQAFLEFNPLQWEQYPAPLPDSRSAGRIRLYRYRTFGSDAALLLLDARSFRDPPLPKPDPDDPASVASFRQNALNPNRTLLGQTQLDDLQRDLLDAQALGITWKFIALPEPIQPLDLTSAQDRYAGYAAERNRLLSFIAENGITNVVFIAADVHGTLVNDLALPGATGTANPPPPAFEITVGSVAFWAPYGQTKIWELDRRGLLSQQEQRRYSQLPVQNDRDDASDDRDDFIKAYLNRQFARMGHSPVGLADSRLDAELLQGDYIAVHSYGWTEFAIDRASQALTVTTYGVPPYTAEQMAQNAGRILATPPRIVSQFVVHPR